MAVVSVKKVHNARMSGGTVYVNYRVEFDTLDNEPTDCIGATDPVTSLVVPGQPGNTTIEYDVIPSVGADPVTLTLYLTAYEPQQTSPLVYNVQLTYSPVPPTDPNENGNRAIDFSVRSIPVVVEVGKDRDGLIMANSAGEPFRGIRRTLYDREYTVTWKTTNPATIITAIDSCLGKINDGACSFTIKGITRNFADQALKLVDAQYHTVINPTAVGGSTTEWDIALVLLHRADTWHEEVIDEGTYYLDGSGQHAPAPTGGTVLLDGSTGSQLTAGSPPEFNEFWLDEKTDFASLFSGL